MKINKTVVLALVSSAALATGAYASASGDKGQRDRHFGGPGFGMPQPGMISERMADRLDLDDAQREIVKNIMSAAKPEIEALREQLRTNHDALKSLSADDPEVQNIASSNGALATEATLLFTRVRSEIDAVLTDEQRAKLAEFKERKGKDRMGKDRKGDRGERQQ